MLLYPNQRDNGTQFNPDLLIILQIGQSMIGSGWCPVHPGLAIFHSSPSCPLASQKRKPRSMGMPLPCKSFSSAKKTPLFPPNTFPDDQHTGLRIPYPAVLHRKCESEGAKASDLLSCEMAMQRNEEKRKRRPQGALIRKVSNHSLERPVS